ncbi:sirohydrochlorin cobaltochelatase [Ardenticatena maritima]|uniref:Sirohydrochlorin cobaltochelatase n=1 Tax=Ardenticatena maritima TaxID=872965 RepID=A0A0M8K7X0_9CHLR|nr:sirohydrochlorin chelatase [Ardenticatena maritima]GAP63585.1 sirohydrochlorin cobaltochelatase [Ardenticatena maritima]
MPTVLLIAHGTRDAEGVAQFEAFARALSRYLDWPTVPCYLELADPPIIVGLREAVANGATHIIALPLFLGPAGHQKNDVPTILNWARREWPHVRIDYATPLGVHPFIVETLDDRTQAALAASTRPIPLDETAVLLVGRGSRDPDSNSNVFKLARLLWEGRGYGWVETAFYSLTAPTVPAGLERCVRLGARRIIVTPHFFFTGIILKNIARMVADAARAHPEHEFLMAEPLGADERILALVQQRLQEAMEGRAAMNCDLCKYRHRMPGFEHEHGLPQTSDHHHGLRGLDGHHHHHHHHHHHDHDHGHQH